MKKLLALALLLALSWASVALAAAPVIYHSTAANAWNGMVAGQSDSTFIFSTSGITKLGIMVRAFPKDTFPGTPMVGSVWIRLALSVRTHDGPTYVDTLVAPVIPTNQHVTTAADTLTYGNLTAMGSVISTTVRGNGEFTMNFHHPGDVRQYIVLGPPYWTGFGNYASVKVRVVSSERDSSNVIVRVYPFK